jgi:23S rRNA (adenine2503-C2)-methyltransferase
MTLVVLDAVPAPEPVSRPSVFTLLPADLAALGHDGSVEHLFGAIQRSWTWKDGLPDVGKRALSLLAHTDMTLPTIVDEARSEDGSLRAVVSLVDGQRVECVHMPRAVRNPRVTLCISSQVGCAMGCTFCATGSMGIKRNLTAGEIVGQVHALLRAYGPRTAHEVTLVFMGMGEPLHNLVHVERAIQILCHPGGLSLSPRRITVSTSGLVPGIDRLAQFSPRPLLALSVNATTDASREKIMPVTRKYPLADLKEALLRFPFRKKEKVLLEYVLLAGVNDTHDDARRLAAFAEGLPHTVNLIPLNTHEQTAHARPDDNHVARFADWLYDEGVRAFIRKSRGQDVQGACGQLVKRSAA